MSKKDKSKGTEGAERTQRYVLLSSVGAYDARTRTHYTAANFTDEAAERLLSDTPSYADRILLFDEWDRVGRPNFAEYQLIMLNEQQKHEGDEE